MPGRGKGGRWTPLSAAEKSSLVDLMRERAQPSGWNRLVATCPWATPSAGQGSCAKPSGGEPMEGKAGGMGQHLHSERAQSGLGPTSIASFFSHSVFRCFLSHSQRSYHPPPYTPQFALSFNSPHAHRGPCFKGVPPLLFIRLQKLNVQLPLPGSLQGFPAPFCWEKCQTTRSASLSGYNFK